MPTPITHAAVGISLFTMFRPLYGRVSLRRWRLLFVPLFCACLPDLDLAVSALLGHPPFHLHHGVSHTIVFAVVSGAAIGGIWWGIDRAEPLRKILVCTLISQTHWFLDIFSNGYLSPLIPSMAIYWPFSDVMVHSGIELFAVESRDATGHFQSSIIFEPYNLLMGLQEIAIACAMVAVFVSIGRWLGRRGKAEDRHEDLRG